MEFVQKQTQHLTQQQLQNMEILQMTVQELGAYVQELAMENPLVEPEEMLLPQESGREDDLLCRLRWLEENDRQNNFYHAAGDEALDPLARVGNEGGLEETLVRFISRQLSPLDLDEEMIRAIRYLAACLDDDGYLRIPLAELCMSSGYPRPVLEQAHAILISLEPAGVGAADLSQCLALQLERIHEQGPALAIVREHLGLLAKGHLKTIAAKLGITIEQVQEAAWIIRELEPRPGSVFQQPEHVSYVQPDIFVENDGTGHFFAVTRQGERPLFRINSYYRQLLAQTQDREVREYLSGKLRQAENVLRAIGQRESTLLRCAQILCERQNSFFRSGPAALVPLRMSELAEALAVHESTISRTVRGKYLQCAQGVYPLSFFFSRPVREEGGTVISANTARALLRQLIDGEDRRHPLSDQKLAVLMADGGCPISRRTVAKYRSEMGLPDAAGRSALA